MSEEGGSEIFLWENQIWALSNSENSGAGSEEKSPPKNEKKMVVVVDSSASNSQTPTAEEPERPTSISAGGGRKNKSGSSKKGGGCKGSAVAADGMNGNESDHETHIWTERERRKKMRNMFSNLHALLPRLSPKADKSTIVDEAVNYIKSLQHTLHKLQKQKVEKLQGGMTSSSAAAAAAATSHNNNNPSRIIINDNDPTNKKISGTTDNITVQDTFSADQGSSTNLAITTAAATPTDSVSIVPRLFPPPTAVLFQTWTSPNVILNVCGKDAHISVCSSKKPGLFTAICYVLEKHKLELVSAHVSSHLDRSMYMIQAHASECLDQCPVALPVEEIYKQAAGEISFWVTS